MRVCARICAARSKSDKQHFELRAHPNDQINTICKNGRLVEYSLKHILCLKVNENSWEKIVCQYLVLVTDCFINVNQRTKRKEKITHSS